MKNSSGIQINGSTFRDVNHFADGSEDAEDEAPSVRILFLAACPSGLPSLRLDQESKAIQEALRMSKNGERFELEQSWATGDRELQDSLLRYAPDVVHLSAYGSRTGQILLEQDTLTRDLGPRPA